jgi:hypothetical protein
MTVAFTIDTHLTLAGEALLGMLPQRYKDMHGVPGTNIVAGHVARRTPKPDGGVEALALPDAYKDDLARIVSKLKDALNWLPTVRLGPTDAQGRCEVTVDLGARFLDAQGRVPSKSATLPPAIAKVVAQALSQPGRFSPPSRLTYPLTLKSREPLCFPPAKLAGGSAAWPLFTGNVGKGGGNAIVADHVTRPRPKPDGGARLFADACPAGIPAAAPLAPRRVANASYVSACQRRGTAAIEHHVWATTENRARNSGTYSATGANFRLT